MFEKIKKIILKDQLTVQDTQECISLIENNPEITKATDHEGYSLLNYIANSYTNEERKKIIIKLLEYGADPNNQNSIGDTLFMHAVRMDDINLAKILSDHGANIHLTNQNNENALIIAATDGKDTNDLRELIEMGMDPFSVNANGATIMHLLFGSNIQDKVIDFAKYLMAKGFDINSLDNEGNNLWHYYAGYNNYEEFNCGFTTHILISEFLLRYVDINKANNVNFRPFEISILYDSRLHASYFLIASGAQIHPYKIKFRSDIIDQTIKIGEIADKIYNQQIVYINDAILFKQGIDPTPYEDEFPDYKLLQLRLKNLALKNGMPLNLDQHINQFVHFSQDFPLISREIQEELEKDVRTMVHTKIEMGKMIEPILAALLHNYNPKKFPLAPYSTLQSMLGKMKDVSSTKEYDNNFKPENSIDYLLDTNNRNNVYPILLADDQNRNALLTIMKSFILYKPDHRLRQKFIEDCKIFDQGMVKFLYNKVNSLEAELSEKFHNSRKRGQNDNISHADSVLERRNKTAKTQKN